MNNDQLPALDAVRPLVLYELNEVPWRVVDWYVARRPSSALARLLKNSLTFTTVTKDEGELHPWTTWPTFHRGVTNKDHNIRFINQSLDEARSFPPVWETLSRAGFKVGVFGSLQSYPPPETDTYAFYVPDTFARGYETVPVKYSAFQRFNLRQTNQDGAEAGPIRFNSGVVSDILGMLMSGLRFETCRKIGVHLVREKVNPIYRTRRSVFQALVSFDFFRNALIESKPDFCTYFTNHVAGMMHRYWRHAFPEDFGVTINSDKEKFHSESIRFAMDIADEQLHFLMAFVERCGGRLMVASSMGQEAIDRGDYLGEWRIVDVPKFLNTIGWQGMATDMLAMQPDFNFQLGSIAEAEDFIALTERLVDAAGAPIWKRIRRTGNTVNLGLSPSRQALMSGEVFFKASGETGKKMQLQDLGVRHIKRDPGTGYHQPRGILMLYGSGIKVCDSRAEIDSTSVRPWIVDLLGAGQAGHGSVI